MDFLCTPAIASAALFTALLFLDLLRRDYELLPGHSLFGIAATILIGILCRNGATMAAWGLLALPFVVLIVGWIIMVSKAKPSPRPAPVPVPEPGSGGGGGGGGMCPYCSGSPLMCKCKKYYY